MRWPHAVLHLILLAYGLGFAYGPTIFTGFRQLQTDPGDTVLNHYFLEHSWRYVSQPDYQGELWSPPFFYPAKDVLGYSDNLFGSAPLYWLLRCFFPEVSAYQLWMILGFALNYAAMALVLRWFGVRHTLCALGAFVFAFGIPHVQQIGHQQLCHREWVPLAIWFGCGFLREPSGRQLFGCLTCVAGQFITGVYVGWFLGFGLALAGLVALTIDGATRRKFFRFVREKPLSALLPLATFAALVAFVVVPYLRANQGYQRTFSEVLSGMPRWNSWLSVPAGTLWHPVVEPINLDRGGEHFLFGGLTCLILAAAAVLLLRRRNVGTPGERLLIKTFLIAIVVMLTLTMSVWVDETRAGTLWLGVYHIVPGAKAIRVAARIYLILYPLLLIAGLIALDRLLGASSWSPLRMRLIVGVLILLAAAENYYPQLDVKGRSFDHAEFYQPARRTGDLLHDTDAAYGIPDGDKPIYQHELMMMWAGLYASVPVINGYSGRMPPDYPVSEDAPLVDRLRQWLGSGWAGRLAVVQPAGEPPRRRVWLIEPGQEPRLLE